MKTRTGFVSNSSTSSFVVPLSRMTADQIAKAKDYYKIAPTMLEDDPSDPGEFLWIDKDKQLAVVDGDYRPGTFLDQAWRVWEEGENLVGSTYMDNFDFEAFLIRLGVPRDAIQMDSEERFPKP